MTKHRVLTTCLVSGSILGGVSLLMAPQMAKDEAGKSAKVSVKSPGGPTASADASQGIICFGNVDIDGKIIPLFPREFPNPSFITEVLVKEGQEVKEGDVLLRFDVAALSREVEKAKAGVRSASAAVETQKAVLAQAVEAKEKTYPNLIARQTSAWQAATKKYGAALKRVAEARRLNNIGGGPTLTIDAAQQEADALQDAADAELKTLEGLKETNLDLKIDEARGGLGKATAAVALQNEFLKQAEEAVLRMETLTAPSAGTILRVECAKGMTLGVQTKAPPLLFQPKGKLIVRAEVDQEYTGRLKVGQAAAMADEADPKVAVSGKVVRIAAAFLPKRNSSNLPFDQMNEQRVLECVIEVAGDAGNLRLGQKLRVKLGD